MGSKGERRTEHARLAADLLVSDLQPLGGVTSKSMFGGYGVFGDGVMFALVDSSGAGYLRGDESTAGAFEAAGSVRHGRMPYWQIPSAARTDAEALLDWAATALRIAKAGT